jgi:phage portal protein BeeE
MGWWFGRKSAPADARPYVPSWAVSGLQCDAAEEGFARSYEAQYDEVFRRNPVGQRAVRLVSGMLGALTIDAVEGDAKAVGLVQADGLLESIAANLLLHGNAYVQLIADERDQPVELCLLRPERVSVVADERGWPVAYLYRAGAQTTRYAREDGFGRRQLAHIKALNPRDDH